MNIEASINDEFYQDFQGVASLSDSSVQQSNRCPAGYLTSEGIFDEAHSPFEQIRASPPFPNSGMENAYTESANSSQSSSYAAMLGQFIYQGPEAELTKRSYSQGDFESHELLQQHAYEEPVPAGYFGADDDEMDI
jgi:hypothetical protein